MNPKDFEDLKQSVLDMKAHRRGEQVEGVRTTQVEAPDTAQVRQSMGLSQAQFAVLLGISVRTLQNWEQGRRRPRGPAAQLLRVVARHPEAVLDAVQNAS